MAVKLSAGTLLWRKSTSGIEVLIVHPSGDYNKNSPWSIPKGMPDEGESLEAAARRETLEECGVIAPPHLIPLGSVVYKSGKTVYAFAGNMVECRPVVASWEIDAAEFVLLEIARGRLHKRQVEFLDKLLETI